jgi:hypothetical protein
MCFLVLALRRYTLGRCAELLLAMHSLFICINRTIEGKYLRIVQRDISHSRRAREWRLGGAELGLFVGGHFAFVLWSMLLVFGS